MHTYTEDITPRELVRGQELGGKLHVADLYDIAMGWSIRRLPPTRRPKVLHKKYFRGAKNYSGKLPAESNYFASLTLLVSVARLEFLYSQPRCYPQRGSILANHPSSHQKGLWEEPCQYLEILLGDNEHCSPKSLLGKI